MMGMLKEPQKLTQLIGAVHTVIKMAKGEPVHMAGMAGVQNTQAASPASSKPGQSDDQLLQDAIRRLKAKDATLGADLQILAKIAENQPEIFEATLQQLRMMA